MTIFYESEQALGGTGMFDVEGLERVHVNQVFFT